MIRALIVALGAVGCGFTGPALAGDGGVDDGRDVGVDVGLDAPGCEVPAAEWLFDEGVGAVAADRTGQHVFALTGATWEAGRAGGAAVVLSGTAHGTVPYAEAFTATTALSITAWLKPANVTGHGGLLVKGDCAGPVQDWGFYEQGVEVGTLFGWPSATVGPPYSAGMGLANGVWSFVAMVLDIDHDELTFYKDGQALTPVTIAMPPLLQNAAPLTIGCDAGTPSYYTGSIDSLTLWTRALSAADVATLAGGACLTR